MTPNIILLRGLPGVGKTFLSTQLGKLLQVAIIRKDDIYDNIFEAVATHQKRNELSYRIIYQILETNLGAHTSLIIDCPFKDHDDLHTLLEFIEKRAGQLQSILCTCSDGQLWAQRFNQRKNNPEPNNLITDFEALTQHYPTLTLERFQEELVVDTKEDLQQTLTRIRNYIEA